MKLEWRPSLEGAEVRKSFFDASFGYFDADAGLAKYWKFNIDLGVRGGGCFWCVLCANKLNCQRVVNCFSMVFVALFLWPAIWSWGGGHRWKVLKYEKVCLMHLLVFFMHAPVLQSLESSTLIWGCGVEDGDSLVRQQNFTRTGTPSSLAQDRTGA